MEPSKVNNLNDSEKINNNNNDNDNNNNDNNEYEEYDGSGVGERTPLLKRRVPLSSPSDNFEQKRQQQQQQQQLKSQQRRQYYLNKQYSLNNSSGLRRNTEYHVLNMNPNSEINSYEEIYSDNGTSDASSSVATKLLYHQLKAQDDVCFPLIEPAFKRGIGIDYEALE